MSCSISVTNSSGHEVKFTVQLNNGVVNCSDVERVVTCSTAVTDRIDSVPGSVLDGASSEIHTTSCSTGTSDCPKKDNLLADTCSTAAIDHIDSDLSRVLNTKTDTSAEIHSTSSEISDCQNKENIWKNYIIKSLFPVETSNAYFIEPYMLNDFVLAISVKTCFASLNMFGVPFNTKTGTNAWPETSGNECPSTERILELCRRTEEAFKNTVFYDGGVSGEWVPMNTVHPRKLLDFILSTCTDVPVIISTNTSEINKFLDHVTIRTVLQETTPVFCHFTGCKSRVVAMYTGPPGDFQPAMEFRAMEAFCSSHCKKINFQHQALFAPIVTSIAVDRDNINIVAHDFQEPFLLRSCGLHKRTDFKPRTVVKRILHGTDGISPEMSRVGRLFRLYKKNGARNRKENLIHEEINNQVLNIFKQLYITLQNNDQS